MIISEQLNELMKMATVVGSVSIGSLLAGGIGMITHDYIMDKKFMDNGYLLKILAKETNDIKETEKLIKNLHSMLLNTKWRKFCYGRPFMSFEVAAVQGKMNFYIWVPRDMKDRIVDRIYETYPEVAIELVEEDYIPRNVPHVYTSEIVLGGHHTLKIKGKSDRDILGSILAGMKDLKKNELTAIQIIVRPLDNKWQHKGRKTISNFEIYGTRPGNDEKEKPKESIFEKGLRQLDNELNREGIKLELSDIFDDGNVFSNRKTKFDRKEIAGAADKLMEPGFEVVIRIVGIGHYKKGNSARVKAIAASFNELDGENMFKKDKVYNHSYILNKFRKRKPYLYGKNNILTPSELSNFYLRMPGKNLLEKFPDVERLTIKQFMAPEESIVKDNLNRSGAIFALNHYSGDTNIIEIKDKDLTRHIAVQGKTGSGKSEWSKTIFLDHISNIRDEDGNIIRKGRGAMLLEPHGKLADEILAIIPEDRRKDVILFDLFSDNPQPFNFCKVPDRESDVMNQEQLKQKTVDEAIEIFKRTFSDVWSEKNEFFITNGIKAIIDTGNTMLELPRLFSDKKFRKDMIPKIKDPKVKKFFTDKFKENAQGRIDSQTESTVNSVEYKLEKFLSSKELTRTLGQNDCIDFKEILDNDKIIIFKMDKERMSKDRIGFIGGIAIKLLTVGAFARSKEKWGSPFLVLVDEAQNFINESFKDIYYELRKYGIGLLLMHQELEQLNEVPGLINAIYNNVGTSITFTVGDLDGPFFKKKYGPRVNEDDLTKLPSRYGYCRLLVDGHTSETFNIYSLDSPSVTAEEGKRSKEEIINYNKINRPSIKEIDKMIMERFEVEEDEDEVSEYYMEIDEGKDNKISEENIKNNNFWGE